jgi:hypothetical protein
MGRSIYFLVYKIRKRPELSLRVLGVDSKDFIKVRGGRASSIFDIVSKTLNAHAIEYGVVKNEDEVILELPADVGYTVLLFILLVYSSKNLTEHAKLFEELLRGKIPFSKHLGMFIDIAAGLSDLRSIERKSNVVIHSSIAQEVSRTMQNLVDVLRKYGS